MPAKQVPAPPKPRKSPAMVSGVFDEFHCDSISYDFRVPLTKFDLKKFSRMTSVTLGQKWSAMANAKNPSSGYHVHIDGRISEADARIMLSYRDGTLATLNPKEKPPFAEDIMGWVGEFLLPPQVRPVVVATFEKPAEFWRSRFNLPFKVTLGTLEVAIEGVSLDVPNNPFKVTSAWLGKRGDKIIVSVNSTQRLDSSDFDVRQQVLFFNEAIQMFAERLS